MHSLKSLPQRGWPCASARICSWKMIYYKLYIYKAFRRCALLCVFFSDSLTSKMWPNTLCMYKVFPRYVSACALSDSTLMKHKHHTWYIYKVFRQNGSSYVVSGFPFGQRQHRISCTYKVFPLYMSCCVFSVISCDCGKAAPQMVHA